MLVEPFDPVVVAERDAGSAFPVSRVRSRSLYAASFDAVLADAGIEVVKIPSPGPPRLSEHSPDDPARHSRAQTQPTRPRTPTRLSRLSGTHRRGDAAALRSSLRGTVPGARRSRTYIDSALNSDWGEHS